MACYAACAEMLSGGAVGQADVLARYADDGTRGGTPGEVAQALGNGWRGGYLDVDPDRLDAAFTALNDVGPWSAVVRGAKGGQHMVVVDGLAPDGSVRIRDPYPPGSSYTTPYDEFMGAWLGGAVWQPNGPQ